MKTEKIRMSDLVGELCCVIGSKDKLKVRCYEREYPAKSDGETRPGQWVRVISSDNKSLKVEPVNVWLGSCNCYR